MSQYTLLKKNTDSQEFAQAAFNRGCEYPAAPVRLFGIDQNNISTAGIEVGQGEVALSDSRNCGLQKLETKL